MTRRLRPEETHIWAKVAATVRPAPGRHFPTALPLETKPETLPAVAPQPAPAARPQIKRHGPLEGIEPRRKRRIVREQELGPRIDLHGLDQDRARQALTGFIARASEDGWRAVLVITGKGALGDGVLRRMVPHWLAEPPLRALVAGVSEAQRHHGGAGALYVALKRQRG
ncbi:Smr/MutS family protein [Phenylobacterium montanum]|uniref:Smr/MutS family protein n=1 Tax=Phenylobacterium montanum TaxID=2823693 RepID=A0A975FWG0_9CAUL|nr:Smr/MutS family protein [Caulobacter sp. S6]QUD86660.1 Smr/MutS family protein [Caulobacter sp. S6]